MALSQDDLFYCNMSTFHNWFTAERAPVCLCVRESDCYSTEPDKPECHRCPQWGHCQPEWPSSPPDWCWTQICWRWAACPAPRAPGRAPGEARARGPRTSSASLWTDLMEEGGQSSQTLSYKLSKYLDYSINLFHYQGYFVFLNFSCIPIYLTYLWWVCWPWLAYGRRCPCCPPVGYRPL